MGELFAQFLMVQSVLGYIALYGIALILAEKQGREVPFVFVATLVFSPLVVIIYLWVTGQSDVATKRMDQYRERMLDRGIDIDTIEEAEAEFRRMENIKGS